MVTHIRSGEGVHRAAPFPNSPQLEVVVAGSTHGAEVGVIRVVVPPGAGMPEHNHGGSDVVLTVVEGAVEIGQDGEVTKVVAGDSVLILRDERVTLTNSTDVAAVALVSAGPAVFVESILNAWPAPTS